MSEEVEVGHIGGATLENEKRDASDLLSLKGVDLGDLRLCLKLGPEALEKEINRREKGIEYETVDCGFFKISEFCDCGEHTFHDYYSTKEPIRVDTGLEKTYDSITIGEMLFPSYIGAIRHCAIKYRLPICIIWAILYAVPRCSAWIDASFSQGILALMFVCWVILFLHFNIMKEVLKMPESLLFILYVIMWQVCISMFYRNIWHGKNYRGDYPWLIFNGLTNAMLHLVIMTIDAFPEKILPIQVRFVILLFVSVYCLLLSGIYSTGYGYGWGYTEELKAEDGEMNIEIFDKTWLLTDMISSSWWVITLLVLKQFVAVLIRPDHYTVWTAKVYRKQTKIRPANWMKSCGLRGADTIQS